MKKTIGLLGCVLALGLATQANAITLVDTGLTSGGNPGGLPIYEATVTDGDVSDSFEVNWEHDTGSGLFSATSTWTIDALSDSNLLLSVSMTNTTPQPGLVNAGIASVGFGIDPNATSVSYATQGTEFDSVGFDFVPGFNGVVEICAWSANNCTGGNQNNLLAIGDSDSFTLSINGDFSDGQGGQLLVLNAFALKTQTNIDSYELPGGPCVAGAPGCGGGGGGTPTPEPGTIFLMGSGLAGLGFWRWKKDAKKQA